MNIFCVIIFAITLIYLSITERYRLDVRLIAAQGVLLFLLSFFEAPRITIGTLIFVTSETLLFKVIIVPYLLNLIIAKTHITRVHDKAIHGLHSLLLTSAGLILSIIIGYSFKTTPINMVYFIVSFFALYTGLFLIITHKKIFSHLVGFLVIENAVLLLSLAIGSKMPMLINIGILLDIFVSVLILGLFAMRISQHVDELTTLKDI